MLKQSAFFIICFLMSPITGFTLGLGDITVFSKLNEPLKVHIELLSSKSTHIDNIIVNNASLNTYRRSNLPRPAAFDKVRFKAKKQANGSIIVELTTKRLIREPFITFIADLKWPSGHINREYTFLLDPPEFIQKQIRTSTRLKKEVKTQKKSAVKKASASRTPRKASQRKINYSSVIANHVDGDTYTTKRADTLWKIAKKVKSANNVSTYQTMQALFALNPNAFIRNNINLLKQGQTLLIPTQNEIRQINGQPALKKSSAQADKSILPSQSTLSKQQNTPLTRSAEIKGSQQSIATAAAANKDLPETKGKLKIIPTTEALLNTPVSSKSDLILINKALQNSINTIKSLKNNNEDLNQRIKALTNKLSKLDRYNQSLNDKISEIGMQLNKQPVLATNSGQKQTNKIIAQDSQAAADNSNSQIADSRNAAPQPDNSGLNIDSRLAATNKPSSRVRDILTSPVITMVLAVFTLIILLATLFTILSQNEKRKQREHPAYDPYPNDNRPTLPDSNPLKSTQSNHITDNSDVSAPLSQRVDTKIMDETDEKNEEDMDFFEYFEKKINAPEAVTKKGSSLLSPEPKTVPEASGIAEKIVSSEIDVPPEITFDLEISTDDIDAYEKSITKPKLSTAINEIDMYLAYGNYQEAEQHLINELQKVPSDKNLHLKLFECYSHLNKSDEFIQHAKNNINLLNVDMVLRQRIEKIFQNTWNKSLDINIFN